MKTLLMITLLVAGVVETAVGQSKNGFDLSHSSIDVDEVFHGGPPKDGIPAIDNPKFIAAGDVDFLADDDIVVGVVREGVQRAYPTRILVWHEVVNDVIGDEALAVTYCPLCGSAMVFARSFDGVKHDFGVSGLLYRSDVLLYDRQTNSLWSQLHMQGVSHKAVGKELLWLPSEYTTWKAWRERYPKSQVLSTDTGFQRNYAASAYASYFASDDIMFPVPLPRNELPKKSWVIGVLVNGKAKAYFIEEIGDSVIEDTIGGKSVTVRYDKARKNPQVLDSAKKAIPSVVVFWFAWQAFYPDTALWRQT